MNGTETRVAAAADDLTPHDPTGDLLEHAQALELRTLRLEERLTRLTKKLEGNGTPGLLGQVLANSERIAVLSGQWKWTVGVLAAIVAAGAQTLVMH